MFRRISLFVFLLLAATIIVPAAAGASIANCQGQNLHVTAAIVKVGHVAQPETSKVLVINIGQTACTLYGYPGVSAWDGSRQVGNAAVWVKAPKALVQLNPGETAAARLQNTGTGRYPAKLCKPVTVNSLRVFAPNDGPAQFVPFFMQTCSGKKVTNLYLRPFKKWTP